MTFAALGLHPHLLATLDRLGYATPTPIQVKAIPATLAGRDLLAAAQTGTGKTAGFALPILHTLLADEAPAEGPRVLVMVPTRELAEQVLQSFNTYGEGLPLVTYAAYGGVAIPPQIKKLRAGVDILVATPGRLLDLFRQKAVRLDAVRILVLDEADRMLDLGFAKELETVLGAVAKQRQTLLFSATFSDAIRGLAGRLLKKPEVIDLAPSSVAAKSVRQSVLTVDKKKKTALFCHLLKNQRWGQVLVFVKTRKGAEQLVSTVQAKGYAADAIHGDKTQAMRQLALNRFKAGEVQVLVATDVAARGIDIDDLPLVVNLDLPTVAEDYVHRIGRTGRAGAKGEAISLVCADEVDLLRAIEKLICQAIPRDEEPGFEAEHRVPDSRAPARAPSAPKKARPARNVPNNWVGFDDFPKTARAPGKAAKPRPRKP